MVEIIATVMFGVIVLCVISCFCSAFYHSCDLERIWKEEIDKEKELRKNYFKYWVKKHGNKR